MRFISRALQTGVHCFTIKQSSELIHRSSVLDSHSSYKSKPIISRQNTLSIWDRIIINANNSKAAHNPAERPMFVYVNFKRMHNMHNNNNIICIENLHEFRTNSTVLNRKRVEFHCSAIFD